MTIENKEHAMLVVVNFGLISFCIEAGLTKPSQLAVELLLLESGFTVEQINELIVGMGAHVHDLLDEAIAYLKLSSMPVEKKDIH